MPRLVSLAVSVPPALSSHNIYFSSVGEKPCIGAENSKESRTRSLPREADTLGKTINASCARSRRSKCHDKAGSGDRE